MSANAYVATDSYDVRIVHVGLAFRKFRRVYQRSTDTFVWILEKTRTGMIAGPLRRLP